MAGSGVRAKPLLAAAAAAAAAAIAAAQAAIGDGRHAAAAAAAAGDGMLIGLASPVRDVAAVSDVAPAVATVAFVGGGLGDPWPEVLAGLPQLSPATV